MQQWQSVRFSFALAFAVAASSYAGDVYKCSVGGATVFQDAPCANGKKVELIGSCGRPAARPRAGHPRPHSERDGGEDSAGWRQYAATRR